MRSPQNPGEAVLYRADAGHVAHPAQGIASAAPTARLTPSRSRSARGLRRALPEYCARRGGRREGLALHLGREGLDGAPAASSRAVRASRRTEAGRAEVGEEVGLRGPGPPEAPVPMLPMASISSSGSALPSRRRGEHDAERLADRGRPRRTRGPNPDEDPGEDEEVEGEEYAEGGRGARPRGPKHRGPCRPRPAPMVPPSPYTRK